MNMSVNSGPAMAIRTRMQIDGKTDRLGPVVALIGYARVSTGDQKLALQHDALNVAGCERIFDDHASGAKTDRPGLAEALAYLRTGDTLVVWKLDRLGRSMSHLIEKVGELAARGIGFRSLRSEEHTSELQSLMRISYAVFCLKKKNNIHKMTQHITYKDKTELRSKPQIN